MKKEKNYIDIWGSGGDKPPEASDISKNQIKWKPDIYFLKRKLQFFILKAYLVKLEYGVWGRQPPEASDISKNQIKWKPDIYRYFLKRKLHIFFESLCSEIGKKLH